MEGSSPGVGSPVDNVDAKYISGLSTILVATIQEAKDRISQIEYVFCSQIYPNFQSKSKSLQKIHSEARKAAEDAWKEKENHLLVEIQRLELEKQQAIEKNHSHEVEKAKPLKEQEEKTVQLLAKVESQQLRIHELKQKLMWKSKEADEGMELQNKLLQLVQSKAAVILNKGKQLKELEESTNILTVELNNHKKIVNELQEELKRMTEELATKNELMENQLKKIEMLDFEISNKDHLLTLQNQEKRCMFTKLENLEEKVRILQLELRKKTEEIEEGRKLQGQLLRQIDTTSSELSENEQQLEDCEREKKQLLAKVEGLVQRVDELQKNLGERSGKDLGGGDLTDNLLKQIEVKSSELEMEKRKRRDGIDAYKRLKSQYNYLCSKFGLTTENMLPQTKTVDESNSLRYHQSSMTSSGLEDKKVDTGGVDCDDIKMKKEIDSLDNLDNEKGFKLNRTSSFDSPTSNCFIAPKCPSTVKSVPIAGTKRPASSWRDTRSRQCQGGPDPHDDFLDTPLENIRGNLKMATKNEGNDLSVIAPKDMNIDSSDDETQDLNVDPGPPKQQNLGSVAGKGGFKYVEPVRKKADREKLKGVECKQCKKFYDAVLPDNGGKVSDGDKQGYRCEHLDGVSRHRYKYVPPMTPEGFWNIGFDSEM